MIRVRWHGVRWLLLSIVTVLAGCSSPPSSTALYEGDVVVPAGLNGYVDLLLDEGDAASWTWTSTQPTRHAWRLECPGGQDKSGGDEPSTAGTGRLKSPEHGCKAVLLWLDAPQAMSVHVEVKGTGSFLKSGYETGH
jgi:hypothetical protein